VTKTQILREELAKYEHYCMCRLYKHYKGGIYKTVGVVWDTNAEEVAVQYSRIDGPEYDWSIPECDIIFTRPVSDFESILEDGTKRFVLVKKREVVQYVPV